MKALYTLIAFGSLIAVCLFSIRGYGQAEYQRGRLEAIQAQTNTDNQALIAQAETMVNAFSETQNALSELYRTPDPSQSPASVSATFDSMCVKRQTHGVPCQAPRPSQKPEQ